MAGEATTITQVDISHAANPVEAAKLGHPVNAEGENRSRVIREGMARRRMASPAEGFQAELKANQVYDKGEMQSSIDRSFGERDASGVMVVTPGTETEKRANAAIAGKTVTEEIIAGTKKSGALNTEQRNSLIAVLNSSAYDFMDPASKLAILDGSFADKDYIVALKQVYGEAAIQKLEDLVTPAAQRLQEADEMLALKTRNRDIARARLQGSMAAETSFTVGKDSTRLKELLRTKPEVALRLKNEARAREEQQLRSIRTALGARPGDSSLLAQAAALETSLTASLNDVIKFETELAEFNTLKSGRDAMPDKVQTLEDNLRNSEDELVLASGQRNRASTDLSFARSDRAEAEAKFAARLEKMPAEALSRYLIQRQIRAAEASSDAADQLVKEAKDANSNKLAQAMRDRYHRMKEYGRLDPRRLRQLYDEGKTLDDRDNLHADMKRLVDPRHGGGPEAAIKAALDQAVKRGQMTNAEMTALLADKDLMAEWGPKYSEEVITGYIRTGGKITTSTYGYIQSQEWGKQWIEKGLEQNKNVQDVEKQLKAQGVLGAEGLRGFMKTKKGKSILAILTGIAAGLITTPIGGAAIASAGFAGAGGVAGGAAGAGAGLLGGHAYSKGNI